MASALLAALFIVFPPIGKCFDYGGPSVKCGSSVVTETSGPSPILQYITEDKPSVYLDGRTLSITNGACFVSDDKVGEPCSFTDVSESVLTEIRLSSAADHTQLTIKDERYQSTFFAPDCVFPTPMTGDVMPEASLPLSRFMGGHDEVTITFAAFVGQNNFSIDLYEGDQLRCNFENAQTAEEDPQFCQLTFRNGRKEVWFNGKFNKSERDWETYELHLNENFVSVLVNWTQTGNSPEDGVCSPLVMPNCAKEKRVFSGLILLLVLNLLC
ncbi:hypothetical protein SprV_0401674700 [Sparganum proliferum]